MMNFTGVDLSSGPDRVVLSIMNADGSLCAVIDRDDLNSKNAGRKKEREFIAAALVAIVARLGAEVEQRECLDRREITLRFSLQGVGALVHICPVHGGDYSLIHWHNTGQPVRDFSRRFRSIVCGPAGARLHHKATSCPANWYSLAMLLDGGLCLALRGEAFEPFDL